MAENNIYFAHKSVSLVGIGVNSWSLLHLVSTGVAWMREAGIIRKLAHFYIWQLVLAAGWNLSWGCGQNTYTWPFHVGVGLLGWGGLSGFQRDCHMSRARAKQRFHHLPWLSLRGRAVSLPLSIACCSLELPHYTRPYSRGEEFVYLLMGGGLKSLQIRFKTTP